MVCDRVCDIPRVLRDEAEVIPGDLNHSTVTHRVRVAFPTVDCATSH